MGAVEYVGRFSRDIENLLNWHWVREVAQGTRNSGTYSIMGGTAPIGMSMWRFIGTVTRGASRINKVAGPALTARGYYLEHEDIGRTIAYTGVVAGVPAAGGAIALSIVGATFWPILIVGVCAASAGIGLGWMYRNNVFWLQDGVHFVGDGLNSSFIVNPTDYMERWLASSGYDIHADYIDAWTAYLELFPIGEGR